MCTEASQIGLGAHLQDLTAVGTWTPQKELSVNILEIKAVQLVLNAFEDRIMGEDLGLMSNNATLVVSLKMLRRDGIFRYVQGGQDIVLLSELPSQEGTFQGWTLLWTS